MTASQTLRRLEEAIARERVRGNPRAVPSSRELDRLFLDEIAASTALAGAPLSLPEVEALVFRGIVSRPQPLERCLAVADYAEAVRFLRGAPMPAGWRPHLRLEEIVGLHARALRRAADGEPGTWRSVNLGPLPGGIVPPGPSLVPRQMLALVERLSAGPPKGGSALLWVAEAHLRFARIHPFRRGTGRTGRLMVNLLLRRLGLPPFALRGRAAKRYISALGQGGAADPLVPALILARAVLAATSSLSGAAGTSGELAPLASLSTGPGKDALYKAAQRGRLRVVRRHGALFTTEAWIAEYRLSRRAR